MVSSVGRAHFGEFMNGSWNLHTSLAKYLNIVETRFRQWGNSCSYYIFNGILKLSSIINFSMF